MKIERKIKIGVMGCANIAKKSFIPSILKLDKYFELAAVASRDKHKANLFANEFACKPLYSYEDLINFKDLDAIYIPLPTGLHAEWVNKCLESKIHVYAEKSIAMNSSESSLMIKNAKKNSVALMEGYMFQYHSQHKYIKDLIASKLIGSPRFINSSFGFPEFKEANFRYDNEIGGGVVMDAAGYPLRAIHDFFGKSMSVKSSTLSFSKKYNTSMWGSAFLSNDSGLGAAISFGFDNYYQCRYEIWGSLGKIIVNKAFTPGEDFEPLIIIEKDNQSEVMTLEADNHFVKSLKEFHKIIINKPMRDKHFEEIALQSCSLDLIKELSNHKVIKS